MLRETTATIVLTLAALISSSVVSQTQFAPENKQVPRFEAAPCAIAIPDSEKGQSLCGYLIVRENRARRNSPTIRLPLIVLKSNSSQPASDPVLRMLGGPGASSLRLVRGRRFSPWLANRDMIIFEQRGTRYAEPNLDCPEVINARETGVRLNLRQPEATLREVAAAKRCYQRLKLQGIDLTAYDSVQSAADIEDLRRVLGYKQWNLYGISYSSRLMLNVMRDHPQGIRSVVLESALPIEVNYDERGVDGARRSLDLFFAHCASNSKCAGSHPELENNFYQLVRKVNANPIDLRVKLSNAAETSALKLTGDDLITWLLDYVLSAEAETIAAGPDLVGKILKGDYEPLRSYAADKASSGYMLGMRYSVWCREEMPFESPLRIAAQARRYPELMGYEIQPALLAVCQVWKVGRARPVENRPVRSKIPTLILAGEYDAYTPPSWGRQVQRNLPRSYFYEVPGVGHGPAFNNACARRMIAEFLDNPAEAPNDQCLKR